MQNINTTTLPIEFVRDIYAALAGTNAVEFDADDFAMFSSEVHVSAFFGTSNEPTDVQQAVNSAFPYPADTQRVDALVVVRHNGINMARYRAISDALGCKVPGSLFISVNKSSTLPLGTVSIILLAISHDKTKKTLDQPFPKFVGQDEAPQQPEERLGNDTGE